MDIPDVRLRQRGVGGYESKAEILTRICVLADLLPSVIDGIWKCFRRTGKLD
jgi:hypothetical protein